MLYPLGALPAFSGGGILGLSAACCSGSPVFDSDEDVLVKEGRDVAPLFASEEEEVASGLLVQSSECLLARFGIGVAVGQEALEGTPPE